MSARKAVAGDGPYPLPDGWRWVKLGEVAEMVRTGVKPEDMSGDEPYLGLDCIATGGAIERWTTTGAEKVTSNKFTFSQEHVLMGKLRPYLGKIALPEKGGLCSTDIVPLAPSEDLDRRFLAHWLRTDAMVEEANKVATGASLPRISPKAIEQLDIPFPPLAEQRRIAEILDRATWNISSSERVEKLFDALKEEIFYEFSKSPSVEKWESLENSVEFIVDCPHSTPEWVEDGVVCLWAGNLKRGWFDWSETRYVSEESFSERVKRKNLAEGDIVLCREGTVGIAAVIPSGFRGCLGQRLVQIRPKEGKTPAGYLLSALLYFLSPERIEHVMNGATSKHLNVKDLRKIEIPILNEGALGDFTDISKKIDALKLTAGDLLCRELSNLSAFRHRAFRGEL